MRVSCYETKLSHDYRILLGCGCGVAFVCESQRVPALPHQLAEPVFDLRGRILLAIRLDLWTLTFFCGKQAFFIEPTKS